MTSRPRSRLLITGSRTWDDWVTIIRELSAFAALNPILVSGHCRDGADELCEKVWANWGGDIERHPVTREEWAKYGKRAGFLRNQKMVDLGADWCLAFIRDNSPGATMTATIAEKAGIPTKRVPYLDGIRELPPTPEFLSASASEGIFPAV